MSADETEAVGMLCCGSCGITEIDDIKLMKCADCDLVRYCSDKCQQDHRPQHERACKERSAELRDEVLFRQPDSTHLGDCPICFLPLSLDMDRDERIMLGCCSKMVCNGCLYANGIRELGENLKHTCPFCWHPLGESDAEFNKHIMKRAAVNDPFALREIGKEHHCDGNYEDAFEYWTKSAEFGDVDAHFLLSTLYRKGQYVEKDEKEERYHLEEAAIGGHPDARLYLVTNEIENDEFERATRHLIIGAKLGCNNSIKSLMEVYKIGQISKEELAATLRAHQAAVDATKSSQREEAGRARKGRQQI
ncbi:hypothetical protein QTG54_002175 [Skeletonema marinoi]|uniref:MYND-type domain-containing protein n=1 Tax=Skeletonema marinoi TaxID=267567 RepID=A0AAD9DGG2_9STRA|nr:hypothetical protein QTG54_002175 [Skeletonema marinoi]